MTAEEYAFLSELKAEYKKADSVKCKKAYHRMAQLFAILMLASLIAIPAASAASSNYLLLAKPYGLDSETNTDLFDAFYPVGAIYQSTDSANPSAKFGGTWTALAPGRVLVSAGTGYTVGATGGAVDGNGSLTLNISTSNVGGTLSGLSGSVSGVGTSQALTNGTATGIGGSISVSGTKTLTAENLPAHTHTINHNHDLTHDHGYTSAESFNNKPDGADDSDGDVGSVFADLENKSYWRGSNATGATTGATVEVGAGTWGGYTGYTSATTAATGNGTAVTLNSTGTASGLSGTVTATSATAGYSGSATLGGTVSSLSGSVSATNNSVADKTMQPYLVVYIWERTA
ncbi:MAG: hypothetical protein LBR73_07445 [Oscillospiraceae bacterium]|jgi:hypothetical protein|nr:hypothetical protein [Oscillospiraceae bacterium]